VPLPRSRLVLILSATVLVSVGFVLVKPAVVSADNDSAGGPDEYRDITSPGPVPADTRPVAAVEAAEVDTGMTIFAAAVARNPIDDFRYDELVLEGTAREVCAGRLLTGSGWTFNEIVDRFGGSAGTLYYCRERWDTANDPACNGQLANPVTTPNFRSTCWSNHARGRAIDVMVGTVGGGYNTSRGLAIVNWLLAPDGQGNVNANARKLGIQQILFSDRCWNSDGDRGIGSWSAMRRCGIGHFDHVHLDLTIRGANGNVSYWGAAPLVAPKIDTQMLWDRDSAWRQAISWWHMVPNNEEGLGMPANADKAIVGDWDSDGIRDEILIWNVDTGIWWLQNWNNGDSLYARVGSFPVGYDEIVAGDWDRDGRYDDMILWDRDTGRWAVRSWSRYENAFRAGGTWARGYTKLIAGDFDGDGRVNDTMLWAQRTGRWVVHRWAGARWSYRASGAWPLAYDEVIVGDWSAGGDFDETILWDRQTGRWTLQSWANFRWRHVRSGQWGARVGLVAPGDYDNDGRVDDLFLYNRANGNWSVWSFHRNVPSSRRSGTWLGGYDVIAVGSLMD
jgi:hypothetical protein